MTPPPTSVTPQTPPLVSREAKQFERNSAQKRGIDAFLAGQDWLGVATSNAVSVTTARRIAAKCSIEQQPRGGVRTACIKMTVEVMSKLEKYIDEQADMTMAVMKDRLLSDLSVDVSITSIHRALHGMLYTAKGLRIEKAP
uniref:Transposase Tc1-like domain-containing protein n=1 Tax=Phytophthora ramorum TaxID=164328 RepID=H3GWD3_PHYRM